MLLALAIAFTMSFAGAPAFAATEGIAISTPEDLKAMENNPSGSYYLANDIEAPANLTLFTSYNYPFTGTLDGNGHAIKGYTYTSNGEWNDNVALFAYAKNVTFKNLRMTNVNINLNQAGNVAALVAASENCKFTDISVSGKITGKWLRQAAGVVSYSYEGGTLTGCKNSADITVTDAAEGSSAAGVATFTGKTTSCKNSGTITVSATGNGQMLEACTAAGVAGEAKTAVSCSNTGKVSMNATIAAVDPQMVGGVFGYISDSASKCYNKGTVSYSGSSYRGVYAGGLAARAIKASQSYNKGAVTVKMTSAKSADENKVGGLCGMVTDMRNCYNTGSITVTGAALVGGIAGYADPWDNKVISNYNTGKIKASTKGTFKGQVIGGYEGAEVVKKRNIYDNYYTGSGKAYGAASVTWKDWVAKATKVSSISKSKCPKLSSKYWTYSSKYKRMILKNNKEK